MATMTPQQVIQTFMQKIANHTYTISSKTIGIDILDDAVTAASNYTGIQNVIDNMKADQIEADRLAVEEVFGTGAAGMTISQVPGKILNATLSGEYASLASLTNSTSPTTTTIKDLLNERKAYIFLEKFCGIQLNEKFFHNKNKVYTSKKYFDNVDTGAITGSDANIVLTAGDVVYGKTITATHSLGYGSEKTASSIVPESTASNTLTTTSGLTFSLLGETNKAGSIAEKDITEKTYDQLTADEKVVFDGIKKWWAEECTKLVSDSYGLDYNSTNSTTMAKDIKVLFRENSSSNAPLATASYYHDSAGKTSSPLYLVINMAYYKNISSDDSNGQGTTSTYLDRVLAHELTHSVMQANVKFFNTLPQFIAEGIAELTHGIDDERGGLIYQQAADASKLVKGLNLNDTGTGTLECYSAGYMFLRYFAKQASLMSFADDYGGVDDNGGTWSIKGTTATYTIDGTIVATLKGLRAGLAATGQQIDGIVVDDTTITLSQKVLGTSKVSFGKNADNYTLALGSDMTGKTVEVSDLTWTVSKGTAKLTGDATAGYACDGKTITYNKAAENKLLATVSGLSKFDGDVNVSDFPTSGNTITLTSTMIGTSKKVTLKSDLYTLTTDSSITMSTVSSSPYWVVKGTTATYQQGKSAGYTLTDGKTLAYSDAKATGVAATITGLKKGLEADDGAISGITIAGTTITLADNVLGTSTVTLKNGTGSNYTLALSDTAKASQKNQNIITVSGAKAVYKNVDTGYFTQDSRNSNSYKYTKEKVNITYATINGLRKDTDASNIVVSDIGVITLTADALPENPTASTKITLGKKDPFYLELEEGVDVVEYDMPTWSFSKNKALYIAKVKTAGYYTASDGKTVTYVPAVDKKGNAITTTLATVSGLTGVDGLNVSGNRIFVPELLLNKKKVSLGSKDDFYFSIDSSLNPTATSMDCTNKNGIAKIIAAMTDGYTVSADERSINYTKAGNKVVAQIKGTRNSADPNAFYDDDGTINLGSIEITNKVTVSGEYAFNFKPNYSNANITGSSADDTITVNGVGFTITGGKGDDVIDLGAGVRTDSNDSADIIIYNSGDGDDTIYNFQTGDRICTNFTAKEVANNPHSISIYAEGSYVVVHFVKGKTFGSIAFPDAADQDVIIYTKDGKTELAKYSAGSSSSYIGELLYSNNYAAAGDLDALTANDIDSYSVADIETDNAFDLTTRDGIIAYASAKK